MSDYRLLPLLLLLFVVATVVVPSPSTHLSPPLQSDPENVFKGWSLLVETFPENNQSKNDNVVKCIAVAQTWYVNRFKWTWLLSIILTWANLLAAQETSFPTAVMIVPLVMHAIIMMHAVFSCICIVRLGSGPECEFPGCAVCPPPNALLLNIIASNPGIVYACSVQPLQDKVFRGV